MEEPDTAGQRDVEASRVVVLATLLAEASPAPQRLPCAACAASPRSRDGQARASSSRLATRKRLQDARRTAVQHDAISNTLRFALVDTGV